MPTGKDTLNPKGLANCAKLFLDVQPQVRALCTKIKRSADFAAQLDEAVGKNDKEMVAKLLRRGGITKKIALLEIDSDKKISFFICFGICFGFSFEW
ncbi:MAG TPA: hypothetical protein VKL40_17925 [Candidatus Angelobacter sp.]|nr:hypothetical protein [Candidatus Angelobacter sp.]